MTLHSPGIGLCEGSRDIGVGYSKNVPRVGRGQCGTSRSLPNMDFVGTWHFPLSFLVHVCSLIDRDFNSTVPLNKLKLYRRIAFCLPTLWSDCMKFRLQ